MLNVQTRIQKLTDEELYCDCGNDYFKVLGTAEHTMIIYCASCHFAFEINSKDVNGEQTN